MADARIVIAGIGHTAYGKLPGRSTISLNVEACAAALADAGLPKDAVDAVWAKVPTSKLEFLYGARVAEALGIQPAAGGVLDLGGASVIAMISYSALAIRAGMCEVALVTSADNPRTGTRQAYDKAYGDAAEYGWLGIAPGYAMVARRHMEEFGTTEEQLGAFAVNARRNGAANPDAQLRKPISLADHGASPMVVEPLRRDDCALVSDGAAAVIVTSADRARELGVEAPVPVLGFGQGHTSWDVAQRPSLATTAAADSARRAFAMAGIVPAQVDVAQLYDCFSITPLMTLEDYGFCAKGEGGSFAESGAIGLGGELPLNTSGGLLSETGMPGMQMVIEGVRQIRGTAPSQVDGAGICVVSGQGGVMHTHATLVLGG
ncbi:MAG: thiolase family protein [Actinobacteria bacterium]|nr:thiolase family protein [Actinomycetota bacterium]